MKKQKACNSCYQRKQRCDMLKPCSRCKKIEATCIYKGDVTSKVLSEVISKITSEATSDNLTETDKKTIMKRKNHTKPRLMKKYQTIKELIKRIYNIEDINEDSVYKLLKENKFKYFSHEVKPQLQVIYSNSSQLLQEFEPKLLTIFFTYNNKIQFLISPEKQSYILASKDEHDIALKYTLCACAFQIYRYLNNLPPVSIDRNPFYIKAKSLLNLLIEKPNIQLVQANLLLLQQEFGFNYKSRGTMSSVHAIRTCQILGLHLIKELDLSKNFSAEIAECFIIGSFCFNHDIMNSLSYAKPLMFSFAELDLPEDPKITITERVYEPYKTCLSETIIGLTKLFSYFIRSQYKLKQLNSLLESSSLEDYEVKLTTLEDMFRKIEGLNDSSWLDFKIEEILGPSISLISHPFLMSYIGTLQFHLVLLIQIQCLRSKIYRKKHPTELFYINETKDEAKKMSKRAFDNFRIIEEKFRQELSSEHGDMFYIIHFGHLFNLECLTLPFYNDNANSSIHFVQSIYQKISKLTSYWPLYIMVTEKSKMQLANKW